MLKVQGGVQNYAWGRLGSSSSVSKFIKDIKEHLPYAEYWLGTHPSCPSTINNIPLSTVTGQIPYLLKVLSISKPLSIQLHPNKSQAEELFSHNPSLYPDSNHKPEMCIARPFLKLFIGFRPPDEIENMLQETPELYSLVGDYDLKTQLEKLYENEQVTIEKVREYCERVGSGVYADINKHFPEDPGIFFAMFMNYVRLDDGQALVIEAGVPHCYVEGDCIEAMACSDNVVRAGLTPKAKDIRTLLKVFYT